jgi:hypothetical protein
MTDMNADKFINDLGGTAEVSRILKVKQNTVSGWRVRGLPTDQMLKLAKHAKDQDKPIPAAYRKLLP